MKVKLLTGRVGPGVSQAPGDTIEVDDAEARRMIEKGLAAPVRAKAVRKAVPEVQTEKAVK